MLDVGEESAPWQEGEESENDEVQADGDEAEDSGAEKPDQPAEEVGAEGYDDEGYDEYDEGEEEQQEDSQQQEDFRHKYSEYAHTRTDVEHRESLGEVFVLLTEGRQRASPADFADLVRRLGCDVDVALMREAFSGLAGEDSQSLTLSEFEGMLASRRNSVDLHDELQEIWSLVGGEKPVNDCSHLQQTALAAALRSLGAEMSESEVANLIGFAGGEDGTLDYEQFVQLLAPHPHDSSAGGPRLSSSD